MTLSAVSDASPLIALEQIKHLELVAPLFERLTIPLSVAREITPTVATLPSWIQEQPVNSVPVPPHRVQSSLGPGETEAIALAIELGGQVVILDDRAARTCAIRRGLTVMGTVAILLLAKREVLIIGDPSQP